MGVELSDPLSPFDQFEGSDKLQVMRQEDVRALIDDAGIRHMFETGRDDWSAVTFEALDRHVVIINDTHPRTRQHVTFMEEVFHVRLGHKPAALNRCPKTGIVARTFDKKIEQEAYFSAAAALVPYTALRELIEQGWKINQIAKHFGVSTELVGMRMKVTRQWGKYRKQSRASSL